MATKSGASGTRPRRTRPRTPVVAGWREWVALPEMSGVALKAKLDKENFKRPGPRFTATCKYKVLGRTKSAFVQWKPGAGWHGANNWYVGKVSDCKIQ